MLDNRIYTFLKLCEMMNYRATAEALLMTQPAVTQHIQSLEREYNCKLFLYNNKTLSMTDNATRLRQCCESALYNEVVFRKYISAEKKKPLRIGATKTIGNYSIDNNISRLLINENIKFSIVIDNTKKLLEMLDNSLLDFALVEGYFDKNKYYIPEYEFSVDNYDFRVIDKNGTNNTIFPKSFGMIGVSEDKKSIAYLYFHDGDLDYIGEENEKNPMANFIHEYFEYNF